MSSIKPIRTDEDLDAALARMEEIFDAKPGSAEDDELGVLLDLVECYENKHYPIEFPDPHIVKLMASFPRRYDISSRCHHD